METKKILKTIFFPLVIFVRAYRTYKTGQRLNQWHDFVLGGELLVKMNKPRGNFYIDSRSHLIGSILSGVYETNTIQTLRNLKLNDGIIVNIGANIGFFTIELSNTFPGKEIIAIEPNPEAYNLLLKNVTINGFKDTVQTINNCISDLNGTVKFTIIPGKSEYSSIGAIDFDAVNNEEHKVIEVESKLLGDIVLDKKVSLIFMDVEGAEKLVIDGCIDLIKRDNPIILCECADLLLPKFNCSSLDLINTLKNNNYLVFNADNLNAKITYPFNGNIVAIPQTINCQIN